MLVGVLRRFGIVLMLALAMAAQPALAATATTVTTSPNPSIDLMLPGGARLGASVNLGGLGEGDFRFLSGTVRVSAALQ